jgi:hypothetical protein
MFHLNLLLPLILAAAAFAPRVAIADHDEPYKASSLKVSLVRAYETCTVPNTDHAHGYDACAPAVPFSPYQFGPKGRGRARVQVKTEGIQMRFSLTDVRTPGDNPANGVTFTGRIAVRQTSHDCPEPTCTFQTSISIAVPCSNGTCAASQTYLATFLPVGDSEESAEVQVEVLDSNGNLFATDGILMPH